MKREREGTHCFREANRLFGEGRYDLALDQYFRALECLPDSPEVRNNLAVLLRQLGERTLAEQCLHEALALNPGYVDALGNLGNLYREAEDTGRAEQCFKAALALSPDNPVLWNNLGLVHKMANRFEAAIDCLRHAQALPGCPPEAAFTLAVALLQTGSRREGWERYQDRWQLPGLAARRRPFDAVAPEWRGEPLDGKTLHLWSEQGLGDTIQMARFLPALAQCHPDAVLQLSVPAPLSRLLAQLDVDIVDADTPPAPGSADFHLPIMTIPWLWISQNRAPVPSGPYLRALPEWENGLVRLPERRAGRLRVGIVWTSGNAGVPLLPDREQESRSLDAAALTQLLSFDGVDWVSLQYQGQSVLREQGLEIADPTEFIGDLADSAAIIRQLDLVVSVDTVVAHLSAAMGIRTFTLMRFAGGNLFPADGETFSWYPAMTVIRQPVSADWQSVIAEVHRRLHEASQNAISGN
ncbi:tetratricopeptide repeat protein [Paludibacterium paludis]|uniref:Tetratricopeptide repeat protein n=1 Tax=Paludibacterium paludis TaxID=1225769 RepID=A0A918UA09_9NEIS|nr:tetratricopeptide repeat protein [Paludibacterium paludis]GGY18629.1 hypothetical protein GCM10011289_22730 [Paludibacterium paludis]